MKFVFFIDKPRPNIVNDNVIKYDLFFKNT